MLYKLPKLISVTMIVASFFVCHSVTAQSWKAGFDLTEYRDMLTMNTKSFYPKETLTIPEVTEYKKIYSSASIGLDNKWELWSSNSAQSIVISIRGTTAQPESWLANYYAAMVPAKGSLQLGDNDIFNYQVADDPQAAVHVGWLISMAYISREVLPKIDSCYKAGIKHIYITGHSQGGAISFLLTAYLKNMQKKGTIPADIAFKTYCSAGPKPGNVGFSYDYNLFAQQGWAYNVVNADDWVPQTFLTVQTTNDAPNTNIFISMKKSIDSFSFFKRIIAKHLYNRVDKPSKKTLKRYQRYFGDVVSKQIKKHIPGFVAPAYFKSSNYVQAGNLIVLKGDSSYYAKFPEMKNKVMQHHQPEAYFYLLNHYQTQ